MMLHVHQPAAPPELSTHGTTSNGVTGALPMIPMMPHMWIVQ